MAVTDKRKALTKRQQEIFEFLKDKIQNRGFGPTVREIGDAFAIKSPNGVMCHLKALERKGLIRRESNMSRAICLADAGQKRLSLPLVGTAVSGSPIQAAISSDEQIEFEPIFAGEDKACLKIKGTAFVSLGITDGDFVIISRGGSSEIGDLVAALDDRHNVTLCRIQGDGKQPTSAIPGAYPTNTRQILGTVVGIVRRFEGTLAGLNATGPNALAS
ncbi:MAG: transcriptional repressor LexA [Fuerstiella sp.]